MEALKRGQKDKGGHWNTDLKAQHIPLLLSVKISAHHAPVELLHHFLLHQQEESKEN